MSIRGRYVLRHRKGHFERQNGDLSLVVKTLKRFRAVYAALVIFYLNERHMSRSKSKKRLLFVRCVPGFELRFHKPGSIFPCKLTFVATAFNPMRRMVGGDRAESHRRT
jgi:hypothetical protein